MRSTNRTIKWIAFACLLAIAAYISVFVVWWLRCPREIHAGPNGSIPLVACHSRSLPIHSETFWIPAFWSLKNLFGYQPVGFGPQLDGDVVFWAKKTTQGPAPNGGPATPVGNSRIKEAPPSTN